MQKENNKLGILGFWASIIWIGHYCILILYQYLNISNNFIEDIWGFFYAIIVFLFPFIASILCIIQLKKVKTKLAIAGLIISIIEVIIISIAVYISLRFSVLD
ncbi:MAG: hypothetical protein AABY16_03685 [Nanoarchaeota archaeon]